MNDFEERTASIREIPLSHIQSILKIDIDSPSGLIWLQRKNKTIKQNSLYANKYAGCKDTNHDGYKKWSLTISYLGKSKTFMASRIVFLLHNGYLTKGKEVDHIDGNSLNNNPINLRETNRSQNCYNSKISKNNTSGHKGVTWCKKSKKWKVAINANGKYHYFGLYVNLEDAIKVAIETRKKLHGEFGRKV